MTAVASTCTGCALVGSRKPDVVTDPDGGVIRLSKEQSSRLLAGEGSLLVGASDSDRKILVVHLADGRLFAVSAICTHMGCTVGYKQGADHIVCACHGSEFGFDGSNIKGPAKRPLKHYEGHIEGGQVVIVL